MGRKIKRLVRRRFCRSRKFARRGRTELRRFRRRLLGRVRPYTFQREIEFVRLVGLFQAVRFVAGRLRGAQDVELRVSGIGTPLFCRTSGADRWTLSHVFARRHFESVSQLPPQLIVDAGANVGYASVYFANRHPDTQIIAIEPDADNCAQFRKNCAAYPNVRLMEGALWSSSADLIIENPTARSQAFRVMEAPAPTNDSIKGFTVTDILALSGEQQIDLLKMDIEGSEEQLFSSNFSNWAGRVQRMLIEAHGRRRNEIVFTAARDHGFSVAKRDEYLIIESAGPRSYPGQEDLASRSGRSASVLAEHESGDSEVETEAKARRIMEEVQLLQRSIEHLHGPEEVPYGADELVVVCIVRDGRPLVRSFVEHYRSLGVKHVAFLDNDSTDGTVEALQRYDNVTVLRTKLPYKAAGLPVGNGWTREVLFKQYLISRFGAEGRWCLCADVDELFDYPYSDVVDLGSFLGYLSGKSYTAVMAQMLDMFSERPLSKQTGDLDVPVKALYRYYDDSNMKRRRMNRHGLELRGNVSDSDELEVFTGGIRESLFSHWHHLTKFPLVFNDGKTRPMDDSSHLISNAKIADVTGVLFHYKFLDKHFQTQVDQALREEHRFENSAVYKKYAEVLAKNPSLQLKRETAREIKSVNDLLENGILVVSDDYVRWVDAEEERSVSRTAPQGEPRELVEAYLDSRRRERAKILKIQRLERQLRHARRMGNFKTEYAGAQSKKASKQTVERPKKRRRTPKG
jgi:FkbM family methyltransferase